VSLNPNVAEPQFLADRLQEFPPLLRVACLRQSRSCAAQRQFHVQRPPERILKQHSPCRVELDVSQALNPDPRDNAKQYQHNAGKLVAARTADQ
jgi:hypothetical protein